MIDFRAQCLHVLGSYTGQNTQAAECYMVAETVLQTLKGDKLTVLFTITFPPQPAKFDSVLVSLIDISERKRAERELWRMRVEMGRVERLATLGKMTGTIAHEVGTPLNSVLG